MNGKKARYKINMRESYFCQYESPNIVIEPTDSVSNEPSNKKPKLVCSVTPIKRPLMRDAANLITIPLRESASSSKVFVNNNEDSSNVSTFMTNSWASNYLQSIGHPCEKKLHIKKKIKDLDKKKMTKIIKPTNKIDSGMSMNAGYGSNSNPGDTMDKKNDTTNKLNNTNEKHLNDISLAKSQCQKNETAQKNKPLATKQSDAKNNVVKDKDIIETKHKENNKISHKTKSSDHKNDSKIATKTVEKTNKHKVGKDRDITETKHKENNKISHTKTSSDPKNYKKITKKIVEKTKSYSFTSRSHTEPKYNMDTKSNKQPTVKVANSPRSKIRSLVKKLNTHKKICRCRSCPDCIRKNDKHEYKQREDKSSTNRSTKTISKSIIQHENKKSCSCKNLPKKNKTENSNENKEINKKKEVKSTIHRLPKNVDLRNILSRKNENSGDKTLRKGNNQNKCRDKLLANAPDNLVITVDNKHSTKNESKPKNHNEKSKTNMCKTINLVINIIYKQKDSSSGSDNCDEEDNNPQQPNADLSFLDDFDVDEIVESLNYPETKNTNHTKKLGKRVEINGQIESIDDKNLITGIFQQQKNSVKIEMAEPCKENENKTNTSQENEQLTSISNLVKIEQNNTNKDIKMIAMNTKHYKENARVVKDEAIDSAKMIKNEILDDVIVIEDTWTDVRENKTIQKENTTIIHTTIDTIDLTDEDSVLNISSEPIIIEKENFKEVALSNYPQKQQILIETINLIDNMEPNNQCDDLYKNVTIECNPELSVKIESCKEEKSNDKQYMTSMDTHNTTIQFDIDNISKSNETCHKNQQNGMGRQNVVRDEKLSESSTDIHTKIINPDHELSPTAAVRKTCIESETSGKDNRNAVDIQSSDKSDLNDNLITDISPEENVTGNSEKQNNITNRQHKEIGSNNNEKEKYDCTMAQENISESYDTTNETKVEVKDNNSLGEQISLEDKTLAPNIENAIQHEFGSNIKYTVSSLIRVGRFSKIFYCQDARGRDYAAKVLKRPKNIELLGELKTEMFNMIQATATRYTNHCIHLVRGFSFENSWLFLMEFYPKNLQQALEENNKSFHINVVQNLSRQLVTALSLLRSKNIVHLDVQPHHILLNNTNEKLKLCGFDMARYVKGPLRILPGLGTVNYRAPEVIVGFPCGYGIDVWAAAVVMYEIATNGKLFPGIFNNDILFKQMCTLGSMPVDMIERSTFRSQHFYGTSFRRFKSRNKKDISLITKFRKSDRLMKTLFCIYELDWPDSTSEQKEEDCEKLMALFNLLVQMLEIHPDRRLPIEFASAHPFLFEMYYS